MDKQVQSVEFHNPNDEATTIQFLVEFCAELVKHRLEQEGGTAVADQIL